MRILPSNTNDTKFNRNDEGELAKYLFECILERTSKQLGFFKSVLAGYDRFFDGILQRDALECFIKFVDFLHSGTKSSLIDCVDFPINEDDFVTSLAKTLFTSTLRTTFICSICHQKTESELNTQLINIYPENKKYVSELLLKSFSSKITKTCIACSRDTLHKECTSLVLNPNILVIVVNRFNFDELARKDKTSIFMDRNFHLNSIDYDLVGGIFHHGDSLNSGHYTCKIYYTNAAFNCNDEHVIKYKPKEELSDSLYIAFYKSCN